MKIAILANAASIHTLRLANGLVSRGHEVHLLSVHRLNGEVDGRVILHILPFLAPFGYILSVLFLRKMLKGIKPDILNAHYATGYGLLARLSGFKPFLLSVWGSDIYNFPKKSVFHRLFLRSNLKFATAVGSTSRCMAKEVVKIFPHPHIFETPFGIDSQVFVPVNRNRSISGVVVGTIKALKDIYGVDTLIRAFALVCEKIDNDIPLFLEITGGGPELENLKLLASDLGIASQVIFHGAVCHSEVSVMLSRLDIYVALSREESFGVAVLEASACALPVVVSDADGLREVTLDCEAGFVVPKNDPLSAANAIFKLVVDAGLRSQMGDSGRKHVLSKYTWERSIEIIEVAYKETIKIYATNDLIKVL